MGVGGQRHASAKQTRYPLHSRDGGPQGQSGRVRKNSRPRPVQSVASRYTDWAIPVMVNGL
jgi:hypothetical protein